MEIDLKDLTDISMELRFSFDNRFIFFASCTLSNREKSLWNMQNRTDEVEHVSTSKPIDWLTYLDMVIVDRKTGEIINVEDLINPYNKRFLSFGRNENIFYQSSVEDEFYLEQNYENLQMFRVTLPGLEREFVRDIEKGKKYSSTVQKFFEFSPDEQSFMWRFYYSDTLMPNPIIQFIIYQFHAFLAKTKLLTWYVRTFDKQKEKEEHAKEKAILIYKGGEPIELLLPRFVNFYWIDDHKLIYSEGNSRLFLRDLKENREITLKTAKCVCIGKLFPGKRVLITSSEGYNEEDHCNICRRSVYNIEQEAFEKDFEDDRTVEYYCSEFTVFSHSTSIEEGIYEKVIYEKQDNETDEITENLTVERETNTCFPYENFNLHKPDRNEHVYIISKFDPIKFKEKQLLKIRIVNEKEFEVLDTYYDGSD